MQIFDREVGPGQPCMVVAELGMNHGGDMDTARTLIHAAHTAGADVVKLQKRTVDLFAIPAVLDAPANDPRFPRFTGTVRELREAHEFGMEEYAELKALAEGLGMGFLVTAFDTVAVDFLEELGVRAYKVASHSVTNLPLLRRIAAPGKPVIMSTGMATPVEIGAAVGQFIGCELALLHCVSEYPVHPSNANLMMVGRLGECFHRSVGYSGHELGYTLTLAAVMLGACIVERHFTLDPAQPGFDHRLSLPPDEFGRMVHSIREAEAALGNGVKRITDGEQVVRDKYRPSIASRVDIPAGAVISEDALYLTAPGTGLHPFDMTRVVGRRAAVDIPAGTLLSEEQVA